MYSVRTVVTEQRSVTCHQKLQLRHTSSGYAAMHIMYSIMWSEVAERTVTYYQDIRQQHYKQKTPRHQSRVIRKTSTKTRVIRICSEAQHVPCNQKKSKLQSLIRICRKGRNTVSGKRHDISQTKMGICSENQLQSHVVRKRNEASHMSSEWALVSST